MQTVLIVEDEHIQQKIYAKLLQDAGYTVLLADDGNLGLSSALDNHPDLILLDSLLPEKNGFEVLSALREDSWGKSAKVVFLTNKDASEEELGIILAKNPSLYLAKSTVSNEDLLAKIKPLLD